MQQNDNEKNKKNKSPSSWLIWIYLAPLYLSLFIVLALWIKKISRPKIDLTPAQERAFIAPVRISQKSYEALKKSKEIEQKVKESLAEDPRQKILERRKKRELEKKFEIIGSTPGKLLEAVEYAYKNPPAIKALFDNETVIENFMQRETVKPLLEDINKLKDFLSESDKIGQFLDNPTVTKVINNEEVLRAISESKLMGKILSSAAVDKLINSPEIRKEIVDKNTRLGLLTANYNLLQELKNNPYTRHIAGEYIKE